MHQRSVEISFKKNNVKCNSNVMMANNLFMFYEMLLTNSPFWHKLFVSVDSRAAVSVNAEWQPRGREKNTCTIKILYLQYLNL